MLNSKFNFTSFIKTSAISFLIVIFFLGFSSKSFAATGIYEVVNFQGKVVNKTPGTNVTSGNYDFTFKIFSVASAGTVIWTENFNTANGNQLTVTDGIFRVALGSVCTFGGGSCQGNTNSAVDFNSDSLYLDITFNGETFGTRVRLTAVPYAFNAKQVNGLTVTNNGGNTLNIAANKTFTVSNSITFTGTDSTSFAFPTTSGGTVLTSNAVSQGITSTQTSGTVLSLADSTGLTSALTGLSVALTSSTNSQNKTGLSFDLSGGTGGTYYDLLGTGSTWSITRAGDLTVASCTGCGGASGSNFWNLVSGNGVSNGGYITPINSTADFLLGAQATTSAKFAFTGLSSLNNQTQASFSGQLIVMPNNGYSGKVGIGVTAPTAELTVQSPGGNADIFRVNDSAGTAAFYVNSGGNVVVTNAAGMYLTAINNTSTGNNANVALTANGTTINRNIADSNPALVVNQLNSSSTGDILQLKNSAATVFDVSQNGKLGLGITSPASEIHVTRPLSLGVTGKALAIFDQIEDQDIFTASYAGATKFKLSNSGVLTLVGGNANDIVSDLTNTLKIDTGGAAGLSLGTVNANAVSLGTASNTTTINGGLTVTAGKTFTFNSDAFTDFTGNGLAVSANALTINLTTSGITGSTSSNSGLEVGSAGLTLLKGCTDGQLLEYTDAGGWACAADDTGGGGGGSSNWTVRNGALKPNNDTLDILFGGTSTSSAKFAFMNMDSNSGLDPLASFSGNLMLESRPNSTTAQQTTWTKLSQATAGTIMNGGTANIASISAMAVYNGSLYVGTFKDVPGSTGQAEVYRYSGTNTTWERVSSATPGTIGGTGTPTSGIASVSAMTVFDGRLYIGTSKMNQAEIYRYDGGTTWIKVSNGTAGTIGGTASIDGVSSMAVYQGQLYVGTREHTTTAGTAQIFRYNNDAGASGWTVLNSTAGTFVATNTVGVWAVTNMVVKNGYLYFGVLKPGDADVLRYQGGTGIAGPALSMNLAALTGSFLINGTAVTQFSEVTAMATYNGNLIVGLSKPNGAEVLMLSDGGATTTVPNSWLRLNLAAGQMATGGTSGIDAITSLAVYNGSLYVGTSEANSAEIYRYTGGSERFFKVSGAAGTIKTGDTSAIDGVVKMIQANGDLVIGTMERGRAEIYKNTTKPIDSSYALQFHAKPSIAGGEQNSVSNYASIFFMASASANLGSNAGNGGAFIFSHGIQTKNGSYDVAEDYPTRDDSLEPGDLVAIDTNERGFVKRSNVALDAGVIGVYSEKPALRLTQEDIQIDGGRVIPVALAGRVPVKVSTENGKIKSGDYLTASSVPGVAMKATKTGNVVGQAMASYGDEGIGRITVYVRSNSYTGTTASLFEDIDSTSVNFEQEILTKLLDQKQDGLVSEINTDRIIAGLEIITPKIVTDELIAKKIRAEQIEGLEIITGKLSLMDTNFASLSAIFANKSNEISSKEVTVVTRYPTGSLVLAGLNVEGIATISADLRVKGSGLVEGIFSIVDTLVTNNLIANGVSNFFADVIFKGNVLFESVPTFNNDTGGFAVVKKDSDRVEVVFDKEYEKAPVVSTNIAFEQKKNDDDSLKDSKELEQTVFEKNYSFVVVNKSVKGFTIVLNKRAEDDIEFSWIALAVKDAKLSFSKEILNFVQQALSPTPSISASNSAVQNGP